MSKPKPQKTKTLKGRWTKGTSGNPAGRPPGSRNKSTLYFEELLDGQGETLIKKAVELSLKGDTTALRLCLERICPPRKERSIDMPEITGSQPVSTVLRSIVTAVGEGRLTPGEAESLSRVLESHIRQVEGEELSRRVTELEKARASQPTPAQGAPLHWQSYNNSGYGAGCVPAAENPSDDQDRNEADLEKQELQSQGTPPDSPGTPEPSRAVVPMADSIQRIAETNPQSRSWLTNGWNQPKSR